MSPNVPLSSHGRKLPAHARPSRPAPLARRGHSYTKQHGQGHGHSGTSKLGQGPGWSKSIGDNAAVADEEDEMAGFLHFCATCEKQIVTPGNTILYCSEACRRKDTAKPAPQSTHSPPLTPLTPSFSDFAAHTIIPQRSPTMPRPLSETFSDLSVSDSESTSSQDQSLYGRRESEASSYLEQFSTERPSTSGRTYQRQKRPGMSRARTSTADDGTPSLVHTPTSSVGTAGSISSYRPLPSRTNPYNSTAFSTKSIDLVIPWPITTPSSFTQGVESASLKSSASTLTSFRVVEADDISYKRKTMPADLSASQGSLKQLFRHDAMKASPKEAVHLGATEKVEEDAGDTPNGR